MTCSCRFQKVAARVYATVCYPGPSISVPVHAVRRYVLSDASPATLARATFLRCLFFIFIIASSSLWHGQHIFDPRRNTSRNLPALQKTSATKVVNKLAGRTKYFLKFRWLKKDVAKRTAKYNISSRHNTLFWRLFHGDHMTVS